MKTALLGGLLGLLLALAPQVTLGCACGCGVFDVGTSSMIPNGAGGMVYLEDDYQDQSKNWSGTSKAPAANNSDKTIQTSFLTLGAEYMFNRSWGLRAQVPYWFRYFKTTADDGSIVSFNHSDMGDIRIMGMYTGFSPNMSTGLTFGLKLPNGDYKYANFDRDTEIGTGSTDALVGVYHEGNFSKTGSTGWFIQADYDYPFMGWGGYTPGAELDAAEGVDHDSGSSGRFQKITPIFQVIESVRNHDSGPQANPTDSGYSRILLSPGIEADTGAYKLYADLEFPVYQNFIGNQLVAPVLVKVIVGKSF